MIAAAGMSLLAVATPRSGQPEFDLSWHTIDGGGGASAGGAFELVGTIGQHDPGAPLAGGPFMLTGGFWAEASPAVSCHGDVNNSGAVDVDDLIAVVLGWGGCAGCPPAHCPTDIAPIPDGNCATDVDDLIAIILAWGDCP
jgi:hypothetical protein